MNNVNIINWTNIKQKETKNFSKFPYVLALFTMLNINPTEIKADSIRNNLAQIEVVSGSDIITNIEKGTWTKLPVIYNQNLKTFITTNNIMKDEGSSEFIEDFIVKEMQNNRWISKESQLLFIWTHIYKEITGTYLYDWSDGDENRLNEYGNVMDRAEKCWKDFRNWYIAYTKQRSADAQQRSADAQQKAMELDSLRLKEDMLKFYDIYTRNPEIVKKEEIDFMKKSTKECISQCKKYWIDYKAILLKEVWDKKKVDAILKFYGVE